VENILMMNDDMMNMIMIIKIKIPCEKNSGTKRGVISNEYDERILGGSMRHCCGFVR
jgi:hypothetical protein